MVLIDVPVGYIVTSLQTLTNRDARIEKLEAALRHIIAMAGDPDAVDACRLIMNRAKQELGKKMRAHEE